MFFNFLLIAGVGFIVVVDVVVVVVVVGVVVGVFVVVVIGVVVAVVDSDFCEIFSAFFFSTISLIDFLVVSC